MTERRQLVVDGQRLHAVVSTAAPPSARPDAVLVHGLGVSSRYLLPTLDRLGRHRRTWAVDLPGFGDSTRPRRALRIEQLAAALGGWLDAAGIGAPVLVANSLGCQVVVELAACGHDVTGLVLVGPTVDDAARTWSAQVGRWLRDAPREPPSLIPIVLRDYVRSGLRRPLATFAAALDHAIDDRLQHVTAPVLVVRGENDPIAPRDWCGRLRDAVPRGRLVEVAGAAHAVNFSHPQELTDEVEGFLASR